MPVEGHHSLPKKIAPMKRLQKCKLLILSEKFSGFLDSEM